LKFPLFIKPSDENAVFFFKSGFSDYRCQYRIWQMIVDPEKSNKLIAAVVVDKNNSFFPPDRSFEKKSIK
jgi:hypothetical protein